MLCKKGGDASNDNNTGNLELHYAVWVEETPHPAQSEPRGANLSQLTVLWVNELVS